MSSNAIFGHDGFQIFEDFLAYKRGVDSSHPVCIDRGGVIGLWQGSYVGNNECPCFDWEQCRIVGSFH